MKSFQPIHAGVRKASPLVCAATLLALATLLSGCPSGISDLPSSTIAPLAEPLPQNVTTLGFDPGMTLADPVTTLPLTTPTTELSSLTVGIDGLGTYTFVAFVTTASANNGDGMGTALDPEDTSDTNNTSDVFVAALDGFGALQDVVLVSQAGRPAGSLRRAGNGASTSPAIAYVDNPGAPCVSPAACPLGVANPRGYVRVAFQSLATDLVGPQITPSVTHPPDTNGASDVFLASVHVVPTATGVDLRLYTPLAPYDGKCNALPTEFVSWGTNGVANSSSSKPSISADGEIVAFSSTATNLIAPPDLNGVSDVFRRWMRRPPCGTHTGGFVGPITTCLVCHAGLPGNPDFRFTDRISRNTSGGAPNGDSEAARIVSGSLGEVIAFESSASNLVAGDGNGTRDVFYSVFTQVQGGTGGVATFLASRPTGSSSSVSGTSSNPSLVVLNALSGNHNVLVAFESTADLDSPKPNNTTTNTYLHDSRGTGTTTLLNQRMGPDGSTLASANGGASPADAHNARLSADGKQVVFDTLADNLDGLHPSDANGVEDVLVTDLAAFFASGHLRHRRVSVRGDGTDGNGASTAPSIAHFVPPPGGGGVEAFDTHLLAKFKNPRCINCHGFNSNPRPSTFPPNHPPETNPANCINCHCPNRTGVDVWRAPPASLSFHDKTDAELCAQAQQFPGFPSALAHLTTDQKLMWALGATGSIPCWAPTAGAPCGGDNSKTPVPGGSAEWIAQATGWVAGGFQCVDFGAEAGDVVTYTTQATNLGGSARDDHVLGFLRSTKVERISKTSGYSPSGGQQLNGDSINASVTRNDRFVAFETTAAIVAGDVNGTWDVYVRDLLLGTTVLVSHGAGGSGAANGSSRNPSAFVGTNGVLHVAFESTAPNLVASFVDNNGAGSDVYHANFSAFDGASSATIAIELASGALGSATAGGNGSSTQASLGGNPTLFVAFASTAGDLLAGFIDGNTGGTDVFSRQLTGAATVTLISRSTVSALQGANRASAAPSSGNDGFRVAYESAATDLVSGFVVGAVDASNVFRFSLGANSLVSRSTLGATRGGDGSSTHASISADGGFVAFESLASDLVAGFVPAAPAVSNVFRRTIGGPGVIDLVSRSTAGATTSGNGGSFAPSIALDGTEVAFESLAGDLVAGDDADELRGVYLLSGTTITRSSQSQSGQNADRDVRRPSLGSTGGIVTFDSAATTLVDVGVDTNGRPDVFRRSR